MVRAGANAPTLPIGVSSWYRAEIVSPVCTTEPVAGVASKSTVSVQPVGGGGGQSSIDFERECRSVPGKVTVTEVPVVVNDPVPLAGTVTSPDCSPLTQCAATSLSFVLVSVHVGVVSSAQLPASVSPLRCVGGGGGQSAMDLVTDCRSVPGKVTVTDVPLVVKDLVPLAGTVTSPDCVPLTQCAA